MNSLLDREGMAEHVQMVYIDRRTVLDMDPSSSHLQTRGIAEYQLGYERCCPASVIMTKRPD
jgi:hypothetical protein